MSKSLIMLLCIATLIAVPLTTANASDYTTNKGKVVSIDPLDLLIGGRINATLEMKTGKNNSWTVGLFYWDYTTYYSAMGLGASYRWYIDPFEEKKKSLNGLSIGARADVSWWSYTWSKLGSNYKDESKATVSVGAEVAYKWTFDSKWAVEPIFKLGIPVIKPDWHGWSPNVWGLGVNLGYAF